MLIDNLINENFDYCAKSQDIDGTVWRTCYLRDAIVFKIPWKGINEAEEFWMDGKNQIGKTECNYARSPYENIFLDIGKDLGFWVLTKQLKTYGAYSINISEFSPFINNYVNKYNNEYMRMFSMYLFPNGTGQYNFICGVKIDTEQKKDMLINSIKNNEQPLEHLNYSIHIVIRILTILNCHNIVLEKIRSSENLNKKRIKNKKLPLLSYYILKIKSKKSYSSNKLKHLWSNRLHLCRGHFKKYTKDNPLFGKYIGLYWWQPHVRGNKKKGIIMKDYAVSEN